MTKKSTKYTRAVIASSLLLSIMSAMPTTVYAKDPVDSLTELTPGNVHTEYEGPFTYTKYDLGGTGTVQDYPTPTAKDRCSLKYFGVDKYKVNAEDVKVTAYHIVEGNYNNYGFLGWTETLPAFKVVQFATFDKASSNRAQVVIENNIDGSPLNNHNQVITSDDVTTLARAIMTNTLVNVDENDPDATVGVADALEKVELTWSNEYNCYYTDQAEAGMYLVLVEKEDRGTIYNPVIISNDYASANIARSLSNYQPSPDAQGNGSLHDQADLYADFPTDSKNPKTWYENGINRDNSAFVAYGSVYSLAEDRVYEITTNTNRDKSPQTQQNYINSHETTVYYKDTQLNGNVYSIYKDNATPDASGEYVNTDIETMALKGVAYAKKSTIPVEKNIVNASVPKTYAVDATNSPEGYSKYDDVSEGDAITYDVYTKIPYYSSNYFKDETNFLFAVTDTQHSGLAPVKVEDIEIYAGDSKATDAQAAAAVLTQGDQLNKSNYEITINDNNSFTVSFTKDFCLANPSRDIIIRYNTTVTNNTSFGLNGNTNEVFLEYTTIPTKPDGTDNPKPSRGYKFDFAVIYTFSPTAFKLGEDGDVLDAVDADGIVTIEDQKDLAAEEKVTKPLANAKFKLQRVGSHYSEDGLTRQDRDLVPDTTKWHAATDALEKDPKTSYNGYQTWFMTSDETGMIKFDSEQDGIDEGIYTLQEVEAPKDYTINERIYVIKVLPEFDTNVQRFIGADVKFGVVNNNTVPQDPGYQLGAITKKALAKSGAGDSVETPDAPDAKGTDTNDTKSSSTSNMKFKYDVVSMTFVDGTNYDYDQYQKLIKSYTNSEWVSEQIDKYDGKISNLNLDKETNDTAHVTTVKFNVDNPNQKDIEANMVGIVNTKLTRLPTTGGLGTVLFTIGGFITMGLAMIIAKKKKLFDK